MYPFVIKILITHVRPVYEIRRVLENWFAKMDSLKRFVEKIEVYSLITPQCLKHL